MAFDPRHTFRAFRYRNFRLFYAGQGLSLMGTWLQQVAMGWLTYRLTGSAWLLGVVAFCASIGILLLGPLGGVVADRVNRRRGLMVTQSLMLAQAVVLALLTALGYIAVWHLIVLALWLGTLSAFDVPMRQSLFVHLVDDRADMPNAIALNSMMVNLARIVGPAIAGLLVAWVGEAWCFALNALSFVAVILALSRLHWPHEARHSATTAGWLASWIEGARFAFGFGPSRVLLVLLAIISWTISPYSTLMPIYAKDVYGGGPDMLGLLLASAGAGALACMIYLASRKNVRGLGRVIARATVVAGVCLGVFAIVRNLPAAMVLMALVGGGLMLAVASANTILQTIVEDRLRGRMASYFTIAFLGVAPLGNLAAGALAAAIGAPLTLVVNGVLCVVAAAYFWYQLPKFRELIRPTYRRLGIVPDDS
jgi:MFS family permease